MRVPTFSSYTFQDIKGRVLGGHPEPPTPALWHTECVAQLVTDQAVRSLGKKPGQTMIGPDSVEDLFANVGERSEIVLTAGYTVSQDFVAVDWLPDLRQKSFVVPDY